MLTYIKYHESKEKATLFTKKHKFLLEFLIDRFQNVDNMSNTIEKHTK